MLNKNILLVLQYPTVQRIKSYKWFCTALVWFKLIMIQADFIKNFSLLWIESKIVGVKLVLH